MADDMTDEKARVICEVVDAVLKHRTSPTPQDLRNQLFQRISTLANPNDPDHPEAYAWAPPSPAPTEPSWLDQAAKLIDVDVGGAEPNGAVGKRRSGRPFDLRTRLIVLQLMRCWQLAVGSWPKLGADGSIDAGPFYRFARLADEKLALGCPILSSNRKGTPLRDAMRAILSMIDEASVDKWARGRSVGNEPE